jgi:hypothetical protein
MAVGLGALGTALISSALAWLILAVLWRIEHRVNKNSNPADAAPRGATDQNPDG